MGHLAGLRLVVLHLELLVQGLDVVLDLLDELGLVLPDGAADVGPHKQRVEAREDLEHLVGVLGRAELVPEDTDV